MTTTYLGQIDWLPLLIFHKYFDISVSRARLVHQRLTLSVVLHSYCLHRRLGLYLLFYLPLHHSLALCVALGRGRRFKRWLAYRQHSHLRCNGPSTGTTMPLSLQTHDKQGGLMEQIRHQSHLVPVLLLYPQLIVSVTCLASRCFCRYPSSRPRSSSKHSSIRFSFSLLSFSTFLSKSSQSCGFKSEKNPATQVVPRTTYQFNFYTTPSVCHCPTSRAETPHTHVKSADRTNTTLSMRIRAPSCIAPVLACAHLCDRFAPPTMPPSALRTPGDCKHVNMELEAARCQPTNISPSKKRN